MRVTHDAGGTLSNEDNFLREASLCREIFTVVWRYWITLVGGLRVRFGMSVDFFFSFSFFWESRLFGVWRDDRGFGGKRVLLMGKKELGVEM